MKIIYLFKNLEVSSITKIFLKRQILKINKLLPKNQESWVEIELIKDKEIKGKKGQFKVKIALDVLYKELIIAEGEGKDIFQAFNDALKKLKRQLVNFSKLKRVKKS
jgi:ribosomal subunit interface protein